MHITLLGTGTSTGIPVIGCSCRVCRSSDARDQRTRCSCLVETDGVHILIDAGPDFRQQALREGLTRIDAVLLTHHHFDHIMGLDDLRPFLFENGAAIPCYGNADTVGVVRNTYPYIFLDGSYPGVPALRLETVEGPFAISSRYGTGAVVPVEPIEVFHGAMPMFGYRIGDFAYLTDTSRIPEHSYERLQGLEVLVLDALRREHHPTHFSFEEAVEAARRIGAKQTYFIHMTHSVSHVEQDALLPDHMALGYDGLRLEVG